MYSTNTYLTRRKIAYSRFFAPLHFFAAFAALLIFTALMPMRSHAQNIHAHYQDGKIYFKLKANVNLSLPIQQFGHIALCEARFLNNISKKYPLIELRKPFFTAHSPILQRVYSLTFKNPADVDKIIRELSTISIIEYAEKAPLLQQFYTPNDPSYNSQQAYLSVINAPLAWDISKGSDKIVVAVIDGAVSNTHPDLKDNIYINPNEIAGNNKDDDNNGFIDDVKGWDTGDNDNNPNPPTTQWDHGTHVAGISGATTDNNTGIASIGFNISIMPIKAQPDTGQANYISFGYEGAIYATDNGAHVLNTSWGGPGFFQTGQYIVDYVYNRGVVWVSAAGNANDEVQNYPAAFNHVISVANTNNNDTKSQSSTYGTWIDISAPGTNIYSTVPNTTYAQMTGTSMASPVVAGLCGLMLSVNPGMSVDEVEACLKSTSKNINSTNPNYSGKLGAGRIDAQKAVQCAKDGITSLDAGVLAFNTSDTILCVGTFTPVVTIKNMGTVALTAVDINYQVDGGSVTTYSWTGNLAFGATAKVTLNTLTLTDGDHAIKAYTANPNAGTDVKPSNDARIQHVSITTKGRALPFVEGFESATFPPSGWQLFNYDDKTTWQRTTLAAKSGTASAYMDNFNYKDNKAVDELMLPNIDLTSQQGPLLTFYLAYQLQSNPNASQTWSDTLMAYISTDCGKTYTQIYKKFGTALVTAKTVYAASKFVPTASEWRMETIDLKNYAGSNNAIISFVHINDYENSLYIDDVNVAGLTGVNEPTIEKGLSIYPNPGSGVIQLRIEGNTSTPVKATIINTLGQVVFSSNLPANTNTTYPLDMSGFSEGVYFISVQTENEMFTQKFVLSR